MSLETYYNNPEVLLTTQLTSDQKLNARMVICASTILASVFLVSMGVTGFILMTALTACLAFLCIRYFYRRPCIVMDGSTNSLTICLQTLSGKTTKLKSQQIDRIVVEGKSRVINKKTVRSYFPRFIVRNKRKPHKKIFLNGFELDDIVQAHYVAQLVANFTCSRAYDVRGSLLPDVKSFIPMKYLSAKAKSERKVYQPSAKKQKKRRTAGRR